jgi:YHS domain-containing protein
MSILAFIFRLILFLIVFRLAGIVLRSFLGGLVRGTRPPGPSGGRGAGQSGQTKGQIEELVKDPICGVHTARSSAIAGRYDGRDAYFCSPECAEKARDR